MNVFMAFTHINTNNYTLDLQSHYTKANISMYLVDKAVRSEGDPSQGKVELVHALLQCEQVAVHRDLHDGLSVDLDHQAPPLLLHRDLRSRN